MFDGISDFNALHSRKHDQEVQLYAFDLLATYSDDLGELPLHLRKTHLERLLARRPEGIIVARLSAARSVPIYSAPRAEWAWRG